jgi:LmbE family N-acetylglucosaminyl deacetylase
MMKIARIFALVLTLSLGGIAQNDVPQAAPAAPPSAPATPAGPKTEERPKADERLRSDVLLVVAHPDDESGVSAYLAQLLDQGKRVSAVYLTHGEAGHNNMGRERGPSLGLAREMELRHAMTQLGVQNVWFLDGKDTPSQDVLQSLANWHHGTCLEGVVRIIRLTRPYVIMTYLPGVFIGENHGDHQAAGVIATEAFDIAGDSAVFPSQLAQPRHINETLLEGLEPWQPQKLYFFSDASDDSRIKGKGPSYPTTGVSPSKNKPYWRISMDTFRFHLTQYRTYIEKLGSMSDEQLEKVAGADQDGWATPVELVFGKSLVGGTVTGDVFEGVQAQPPTFEKPIAPNTKERTGLSVEIGGPWAFYDEFRPAHDLADLPRAEVSEIAVAAGTTLQLPLILRNDDKTPVELTVSATLPEGWALKSPLPHYKLAAGDVFPIQVELTTPPKKSDQVSEIVCHAYSGLHEIGTVRVRVSLRSGGLPQ